MDALSIPFGQTEKPALLETGMTTAKIFAYKGHLGVDIDPEGKFINDPWARGQLGFVISTQEVEITREAKDLIRQARREGGSFAELMLTRHAGPAVPAHGKSSLGFIGGSTKVHYGPGFKIGRECHLEALDDCVETEMDVPAEFKRAVA